MEKYTITKSSVECYKLRHSSGLYWADITVDANESKGRIQIASDYGSWQYYWGSCGKPFKEFLMTLGKDYVAGKFGESKFFMFEETILQYKQTVIEQRRCLYLDTKEARKIWDEIKELEKSGASDESGFQQFMLSECDRLMRLFDFCPPTRYGISPQFEMFWQKAWPAFIMELKSELTAARLV